MVSRKCFTQALLVFAATSICVASNSNALTCSTCDPGTGDGSDPGVIDPIIRPVTIIVGPNSAAGPGQTRNLIASGGTGSYSFSVVGISPYNPSYMGKVVGTTYTAPSSINQDYTVTIQAVDSAGSVGTRSIYLHPKALTLEVSNAFYSLMFSMTDSNPGFYLGFSYDPQYFKTNPIWYRIAVSGGRAPYKVSVDRIATCSTSLSPITVNGVPILDWGHFRVDGSSTTLSPSVVAISGSTGMSFTYTRPDSLAVAHQMEQTNCPSQASRPDIHMLMKIFFNATDSDGTLIQYSTELSDRW